MDSTILIVGAGQAGCSAALALRRHGHAGRIVLLGDETAHPYERPPLSKAHLVGEEAMPPALIKTVDLDREQIELRTGQQVRAIDPPRRQVSLSDGSSLGYDALLLATGGRARALAVPGGELALGLRTHDDALRLRERLRRPGRLVVVGAGVIGLEVAATARGLGWQVRVLEQADRPMARQVPAVVGKAIAALHLDAGVEFGFGVRLERISRLPEGAIRLEAGSVHHADLVVAGIGLQPNIELAQAAGLRIEGGIVVDACGRTSADGVYAAGDVAALWHPRYGCVVRFESWQHAARHAATVAGNMLGAAQPYDEVPWSWSDQYDWNLQIVGLPCDGDTTVFRGTPGEARWVAFHLRTGTVVGATLMNQGREMRPCKALIEAAARPDPALLADSAMPLRDLVARLAAAAAVA